MHCEGSTGTHVAGVNSPSAEHEDVITPDNSNVSRHPGVHDVPAASVVTSLQPPAANFFVPSLPFSGFVTSHVMSFTHVAAVKTPSAEHEDVEPSNSEYPVLHAGVHDAPGASVVTSSQPPAAKFFVPSLPLAGFVTLHVMSFTHVAAVKTPSAEHEDVEPSNSEYPSSHAGVHDAPGASVFTFLQPPSFLFNVPSVPLPGFVTPQCFTHVAAVSVPAEHDVVVCPAIVDSEYPSLHAGTHDSPVASAVTASQLPSLSPAQPLVGFDMSVHVVLSAVQTPPVIIPSAHENSADNEYPELHVGVHVVPCSSILSLAASLQPSPSVPSVGVV
jgi:hypothetical protein